VKDNTELFALACAILTFAGVALIAYSCSHNTTSPSEDMRAAIKAETVRIRPLLSTKEFEVSGDALISSGLMTLADEEWACDVVRRSQFEDGSFARSPAHRDAGDRDFSRDQGLGVLMAIQSNCLSLEQTLKFVRFLNSNGGRLSTKFDEKSKTSSYYRKLIEVVTRTWIEGSSSAWGTAGIGVGAWFNKDYALHLDSISLYLYDRNNISTLAMASARHALIKRQPDNPWFRFVTGDRNTSASQLLPLLRGFDPVKVPVDWLDWMWQRPTEQWGTKTFANGWDLILLGELLND
jgi:hypothetical protein